ncbi:hypothetical protein QJS66_11960 [Kocuria rhizophila]|nr:hypothetical protein QJS66_11960 [Kocuria rhizophila]
MATPAGGHRPRRADVDRRPPTAPGARRWRRASPRRAVRGRPRTGGLQALYDALVWRAPAVVMRMGMFQGWRPFVSTTTQAPPGAEQAC